MKTRIACLAAAGALAALSGCATPNDNPLTDNVDIAKVNAINRVAYRNGLSVMWLHYPQKKAAELAAVPTAPATPAAPS